MTDTPDDEAFDAVMNQIQTNEGEEAWAEVIQEYGGDVSPLNVLDWIASNDDGAMGYVASMAYMGEIERKTAEQKKD